MAEKPKVEETNWPARLDAAFALPTEKERRAAVEQVNHELGVHMRRQAGLSDNYTEPYVMGPE